MTKLKFLIGITLLLLCQTVFGQRSVSIDVNGVLQGTTSQALFTANSNALNAAISAMSLTNLSTAKTLWVATNGNDSLGIRGRQDRPFLTQAAAKTAASAGDVIKVRPGNYSENDLWKGGVTWDYDGGATNIYIDPGSGNARGIFDDRADPGTICRVLGHGYFKHIQVNFAPIKGAFVVTNANSFLLLQAHRIDVGEGTDDSSAAISIQNGRCLAVVDEFYEVSADASSGGTRSSVIYFKSGYAQIYAGYIEAGAYAVYAKEAPGSPTASLFVSGKHWKHQATAGAVQSMIWADANAAGTPNTNFLVNLDCNHIESVGGIYVANIGRFRLTSDDHRSEGNVIHENDRAVDVRLAVKRATGTTSQGSGSFWTTPNFTGRVYADIGEYRQDGTDPILELEGTGTVDIGGKYARAANGQGVEAVGAGTWKVRDFTFDTTPSNNSANNPVSLGNSSSGLVLQNCNLLAPAAASSMAASVARTVEVTGVLQANATPSANVSFSKGMLIVNTNTYLAGPLTMSTSGNVPVPPSGSYSLFYSNNTVYVLKATGGPVDLEAIGAAGTVWRFMTNGVLVRDTTNVNVIYGSNMVVVATNETTLGRVDLHISGTGTGGGGLSDGDKGDITVGGSGTTLSIDNQAVTLAKLTNASAQGKFLVRWSSGAGSFQEGTISTGLTLDGSGNLTASGTATAWDALGDPSATALLDFGNTEQTIRSTANGNNGGALILTNTVADLTSSTFLVRLYFRDTNDADGVYLSMLGGAGGANLTDYSFGQQAFLIGDTIATTFNGTIRVVGTARFEGGYSLNGSTATTNNAAALFNGTFAMPPFTNTALTVNQGTNVHQSYTTNADFTVTFTGTALDGARGQFDIYNTANSNITATWPSSYSVAQAAATTLITCPSNSLTVVYWEKVSGTNRLRVESKEAIQDIGPNVAIGQVLKIHQVVPSLIITNATDDTGGGAGGGTNTALFVQTNDVSVANTGTETTILGSGVGSKTLAANYLIPGRNIRGTLRGTYSDDIATPGTVRIRVKLGGTTVLDTTAQTPASGVTDDYFEVHFDITCRENGASGKVWAQGQVSLSDGLITAQHVLQMINSAPATIDTTASQAVDVTWQWGTADSDNTMTNHMAVIVEGPGVTIGTDGTVTSVSTGTGLTGGPVTTTGTISMADMAAVSVKARSVNTSGASADLAAAANNTYLKRTNDTLIFGVIPDSDIASTIMRDTELDTVLVNSNYVTIAGVQTITGLKSFSAGATAGGSIKLTEDTDNGANVISVKAPDTIASDKTATLPDLTGTVLLDASVIQDSITIPMGAWFTNNLLGAHPSGASSLSFSNVSDSFEFSSVQTVTNGIRLLCALPITWDAGVVRFGIRALCVNTNDPSATNVVWSVRAGAIKDNDDATSPTYGTAIAVTNAIAKQANLSRECITRDITVGNTPAATNTIAFEISRLTADTGDSLTNSGLRMIETKIYFKRTSNATWPAPSL